MGSNTRDTGIDRMPLKVLHQNQPFRKEMLLSNRIEISNIKIANHGYLTNTVSVVKNRH